MRVSPCIEHADVWSWVLCKLGVDLETPDEDLHGEDLQKGSPVRIPFADAASKQRLPTALVIAFTNHERTLQQPLAFLMAASCIPTHP